MRRRLDKWFPKPAPVADPGPEAGVWAKTKYRADRVKRHWAAQALATVLCLLIVVPGLVYAVPATVGADRAFTVLSGSMVPFFHPGDVIFVEDVEDPTGLQVGDVITFRMKGAKVPYTHRILERLEDGGRIRYITKGDANEDPDPFVVKPEMIEGKYVTQLPYWGLIMKFLHSKWGYFFLILVPGNLVIIHEGVVLYRELVRLDAELTKKKEAKRLEAAAKTGGGILEAPT